MHFIDTLLAVEIFHHRIGAPVAASPRLLPGRREPLRKLSQQLYELARESAGSAEGARDLAVCRAALCLEELAEWLEAQAEGNLVKAADNWADRLVVLLGDAVVSGLPAEGLFLATQRSNMTKALQVTTGIGKAVKLAGFEPPRIEDVLREAANGNGPRNHLATATFNVS